MVLGLEAVLPLTPAGTVNSAWREQFGAGGERSPSAPSHWPGVILGGSGGALPTGERALLRRVCAVKEDDVGSEAVGLLDELAAWSPWVPFADAARTAPRVPGVYVARVGETGPLIYVGMAGERRGAGLRGRLTVYRSGKALASGLGEAVLDRALADPDWVEERLNEVRSGHQRRAKHWGQAAFERADLHVRWVETVDRASAVSLERACLSAVTDHDLWNRLR